MACAGGRAHLGAAIHPLEPSCCQWLSGILAMLLASLAGCLPSVKLDDAIEKFLLPAFPLGFVLIFFFFFKRGGEGSYFPVGVLGFGFFFGGEGGEGL